MIQILPFHLDLQQYGIRADRVERVFRAAEVTPLPQAPAIIRGVINVHGDIVAVVDIRDRFNLPVRNIGIKDIFVRAHTARRSVVIVADSVEGVIQVDSDAVSSTETTVPGAPYIQGVARLPGDLLFIHDLDSLLSLDEEEELDQSIQDFTGKTDAQS